MVVPPRIVIVTDLDGTLLDARDYSWAGARATLARLDRQRIPVVLCSSKTRAEMERCQQDAALEHPFISENGGGLFVPDRYFPFEVPATRRLPGFAAIDYGWRYDRVVRAFREAAEETRVAAEGFNDLSLPKVARLCGLSLREAQLAVLREYDEPFMVLDEPRGPEPRPESRFGRRYRFYRALRRRGLQVTRGGRFDHAHASPGKGRATAALRELYERQAGGPVVMVGLGDARNDLSLLQAVDVPIVVPNSSSRATLDLLRRVPGARLAPGSGPGGWGSAVREVLQELRDGTRCPIPDVVETLRRKPGSVRPAEREVVPGCGYAPPARVAGGIVSRGAVR